MAPDGKKSKDIWEKLASISSLVSGVLIARIGLWATQAYNYRQLEINKLAALDKFRPLLDSEKSQDREFAYSAFVLLGHEELAVRMISQNQDEAGKRVLSDLAATSEKNSTRDYAKETLTSLKRIWFLDNADPDYKNPPFGDTIPTTKPPSTR